MKIKILYEDKDMLIIDKPSGVSVQNDEKSNEKTIFDFLPKKYSKIILAHRLDKETSGVLVFAKNQKAYEFLKEQFKSRSVKKTYVAIVSGHVKNDRGTIDKPIGRSPSDFRRRLAGRGARGELKEAITQYKVLKRFMAPCVQNFSGSSLVRVRAGSHADKNFKSTAPFTYLEVMPKTGRTHQIRVHMKFINHPVACDTLYNPKGVCPKGLDRLALHAKSIEIKNLKGENIKIESSLPKEMKDMGSALWIPKG